MFLIAVFLTASQTLAGAAEVSEHEFLPIEKPAVLNGEGTRDYFLTEVYRAQLFLEMKETDADTILSSNKPKALLMSYRVTFSHQDQTKAWLESFEMNCLLKCNDPEQKNIWSAFLAQLPPPEKDKQILFLMNQRGVQVVQGSKQIIAIQNAFFGANLLATWIGRSPPTKSLKKKLLGK